MTSSRRRRLLFPTVVESLLQRTVTTATTTTRRGRMSSLCRSTIIMFDILVVLVCRPWVVTSFQQQQSQRPVAVADLFGGTSAAAAFAPGMTTTRRSRRRIHPTGNWILSPPPPPPTTKLQFSTLLQWYDDSSFPSSTPATRVHNQHHHHHHHRPSSSSSSSLSSSTVPSVEKSDSAQSSSLSPTNKSSNITDYSEIWTPTNENNVEDDQNNENDNIDIDDNEDNSDDDDDDDMNDHMIDETQRESYDLWMTAIDRSLVAITKKETSLQNEWTKAQNVENLVKRAQLLVSNLYMFQQPGVTTATVWDWEQGEEGVEVVLTLNTKKFDSASAEADDLFAQARKLKRGSQVISKLLDETRIAKEILENAQLDLQSVIVVDDASDDDDDNDNANNDGSSRIRFDEGRFELVKDRLVQTASKTNFQIPTNSDSSSSGRGGGGGGKNGRRRQQQQQQRGGGRRQPKPEIGSPSSNIRKLTSPGGCTVLVGRNRRGNEHLSLSIARGNDIWMHSRGCPGAHVVIMNRRGGPTVTDECLQFGADLAIFYSDLRNENKAEVTAAEPKHIQKPRGAPLGAVKLREEWKTFVGRPDSVPDELKEARDQSGGTDEYHLQDKAMHRKRTREAAEEDRQIRLKRKRERKREQQ